MNPFLLGFVWNPNLDLALVLLRVLITTVLGVGGARVDHGADVIERVDLVGLLVNLLVILGLLGRRLDELDFLYHVVKLDLIDLMPHVLLLEELLDLHSQVLVEE